MAVTVDGVPFGESRLLGDHGPTMDEVNNLALAPVSREHDYCLCIHPFMTVIDFTGMTCAWCDQPTVRNAVTDEARALRTSAILAKWPELRKPEGESDAT